VPQLRPFRGLRYDPARVPDLSAVLCPPYDVISPRQREEFLARDPRNAVRLELPASGEATDADYAGARDTLHGWLADGTLERDERPLVYIYEQRFEGEDGAPQVARSVFCELLLEDYGLGSGIRPHEHTLGTAKERRFKLLSATQTHLSPVLLMYETDTRELMDEIVDSARPREAIGPDGTGQRLWGIDPDLVPAARDLLGLAGARPLTIADGHHRYETALRYRDTPGAPAGADHVLALLYSSASNGLALAPWHRVITGVPNASAVLDSGAATFDATAVASSYALLAAIDASSQAGVLGVWTRSGGQVLKVDRQKAQPFVDGSASESVCWLDVSVLSGTLNEMTGATEAELTAQGRLSYTHDAREAIHEVDEAVADVAFILRATPVEHVLAVAAAGDFMPPKSTYFYPKAATGLVFDPLF
jgi:uncharacterized protein (DUF1015 family)